MKMKCCVLVLMSVLLLIAALTGCGRSEETKTTDPLKTETASTPEVQEEETTQSDETPKTEALPEEVPEDTQQTQEPVDPNVIVVSTAYGNLFYQEQWSEYMKTEQTQDGETLTVTFLAEFNGIGYPLFSIVIGSDEEEPMAQITDANGTVRNAYVLVEELEEHPELTEDEKNCLYAMQEEINYVVEHMK